MLYESLQVQSETEFACKDLLDTPRAIKLQTKRHAAYLRRGTMPLSEGFVTLDAARPWLFYWCMNGLSLLPDTEEIMNSLLGTLKFSIEECRDPEGGFGGGYGQIGHLAPTYAIVLSAALSGDEHVYRVLDRGALYRWLMSLKKSDGGFAIQRGGEVDTRAVYLALTVASLLDLLTDELIAGTQAWLIRCQRYEGGFAGAPGGEAHAGLSYCALAALCILDKPQSLTSHIDLPGLLHWLVQRQMQVEGGFSGRTNKLVDGCYSWWVGAELAILEAALGVPGDLFDRPALSKYILKCCQASGQGGLRDKPGKGTDYYHTCYCLAGLSVAQYQFNHLSASREFDDDELGWQAYHWTPVAITGEESEVSLKPLHPVFGIPLDKAKFLRQWAVRQDWRP